MSNKRSILCLFASMLFLAAMYAIPLSKQAHADQLSANEPVQIAQSDDNKLEEDEEEDDLGEDDC